MSTAEPRAPGDSRLGRLLSLVPYFTARPGIALSQAAADWGISVAQVRADLILLCMCGLPGYGPGELIDLDFDALDAGHVHVTFGARLERPLRLNTTEALALSVALAALADVPGLGEPQVIARALAKIEQAAGTGVDGSTVAVVVDDAVRFVPLLHRAVAEQRAVRLRYYSASRDQLSDRTVDPLGMFETGGHSYLQAWCRQAQAVRLFRADRIEAASLLDEPAQPPDGLAVPQPLEFAEGVFAPGSEHPVVLLQLAPSYAWVADYYACEQAGTEGDQLLVRLPVADTAWLRALVLGAGGAVVVREPAELAAGLRAQAAAALARY